MSGIGTSAADAGAHHGPRFDGAQVLLVDDNEFNQHIGAEVLGRMGVEVTAVGDGAEALRLAHLRTYDMVLMDVRMPVLDGLVVTRAMRGLPGWDGIPILAMSVESWRTMQAECTEAGMVDHVTKPVTLTHLVQALQKWLPVGKAAQAARAAPNEG